MFASFNQARLPCSEILGNFRYYTLRSTLQITFHCFVFEFWHGNSCVSNQWFDIRFEHWYLVKAVHRFENSLIYALTAITFVLGSITRKVEVRFPRVVMGVNKMIGVFLVLFITLLHQRNIGIPLWTYLCSLGHLLHLNLVVNLRLIQLVDLLHSFLIERLIYYVKILISIWSERKLGWLVQFQVWLFALLLQTTPVETSFPFFNLLSTRDLAYP